MNDIETQMRLDRQARQQEMLMEIVRRALQRLTAAESDIAEAQARLIQHGDQLEAQARRMDLFGDVLLSLVELRARLGGELARAEGTDATKR